jgi:hypothetical protein
VTEPTVDADAADAVDVRTSSVHGRGLFARWALGPGEVATTAEAVLLDEADSDHLADHPLSAYLVDWDDDGTTAVPFGPLSFVNHDGDPNAELIVDQDRGVVQLVTRRQVEVGEELTVDYGPDHPV